MPSGQSGIPNSDARAALLDLLRRLSFERKRVVLTSGRESDFFIDCKQAVLTAEGHELVGAVMLSEVDALGDAYAVAGVELGGCPLASAVALTSQLALRASGRPGALQALYVRKEGKGHGSRRMIEGPIGASARVVILEDVITTGGSTLSAVAKLKEAGADVVGVVALVDRLEGGRQAIEAAGLAVRAVFTRDDFMT